MADQLEPKGSLEHLNKTEPLQDEFSLPYQSRRDAMRQRKPNNVVGILIAAVVYWFSIFVLISLLGRQRFVDPSTSLTFWMLDIVFLLMIALAIDSVMKWNWACTKGLIFAFLLTGGLCGLITSICGNPLKPIL